MISNQLPAWSRVEQKCSTTEEEVSNLEQYVFLHAESFSDTTLCGESHSSSEDTQPFYALFMLPTLCMTPCKASIFTATERPRVRPASR